MQIRIPCRTIEKRKEKKKIGIKCGNKTSRAVNKDNENER